MAISADRKSLISEMMADGNMHSPGLAFRSEPGVGIYRPAAGKIAIIAPVTGSLNKATAGIVISDGAVGIGTASPTNLLDLASGEVVFTSAKMSFTGALAAADHVVDFSSITMPASKNLIRGGSYSTPIAYTAASMGLLQLYYSQSRNTGADVVTFLYGVTTGQSATLGSTALVESNADTPGPKSLQGGQFMAGLRAGKYLAAMGGDATAGMYGVWAKVYSSVTSVASSGCRVAALWVDNQMSCTVSGEEYGIFFSTGGSVPDAAMGFETSSSGWASFAYFDETAYDQNPVSTRSCTTTGADSDASVIWNLNGTAYYMPLYLVGNTT